MTTDRLDITVLKENDLSKIILNACIKVHKELGPGLLESAYEACLEYELKKVGLDVKRQVSLPLQYDDVFIDCAYIADLIINDLVIIELKAVKKLDDIHMAQILSYLRISKLKLGLLINFNETTFIQGFKRIVNGL